MTGVLVKSLSAVRSYSCTSLRRARFLHAPEESHRTAPKGVLTRTVAQFPGRQNETAEEPSSFVHGDAVRFEVFEGAAETVEDSQKYRFFITEPVFPVCNDDSRDTPQTLIDATSVQVATGS